MRTPEERNPSLLYTEGWQRVERSNGELVGTFSTDAAQEYAPVGGKLADTDIRHLCNGQYAIVQPGRPPQVSDFLLCWRLPWHSLTCSAAWTTVRRSSFAHLKMRTITPTANRT